MQRVALLLDVLLEHRRKPVRLTDLAKLVGAPKSSVWNICFELERSRLIQRRGDGYVLGSFCAELGAAYADSIDVIGVFHEVVDEVLGDTEETLQLATLGEGLDVVYLARRDGRFPIRLATHIGLRVGAHHTGAGKALLGMLPEHEFERRLASAPSLETPTKRSIRSTEELRREIVAAKRKGFAVDNEETVEGISCIAMGVSRGAMRNEPLVAVSFSLLKTRATRGRIQQLREQLQNVVDEMSIRMGREIVTKGVGRTGETHQPKS